MIKLDKISKIAIKVIIVSIILILLSHGILYIVDKVATNKSFFRAMFFIGYVVIYASVFVSLVSLVILTIQLLRRLIIKRSS